LLYIDKIYAGLTAREPFGVALVGRRLDGRVVVGGCFEDPWTVKLPLEQLRDLLKQHQITAPVSGWIEDGEGWIELAELAKRITGIDFQGIYQPIIAARQAAASLLTVQGPVTSKFQVDQNAPGAELLAQRIDGRVTGGMTDAVGLCCLRIEHDYPGGLAPVRTPTKVILRREPGGGVFGGWSGRR
jgi:hypothetical protein